jgi:hypothetical protein
MRCAILAVRRSHAYSVEEVEAILKAAGRPRDIAFLRTVYGCGLRVMEAATLRARGGIDRARSVGGPRPPRGGVPPSRKSLIDSNCYA